MMTRMLPAVVLLFQFVAPVHAGNYLPAPKKLSPHAYAWIGPLDAPSKKNHGYRMNLGFVVGSKAVAVIDSGYTEDMARQMLAHIGKITSVPVTYVVNTNSQPHRFMGNDVFRKAGAKTIAHKRSAQRMVASGGQFATAIERILELKTDSVKVPGTPDMLLEKDKTLDLGGVSVTVKPFGAGHTPAQLVVHVKQDKLVFSGDILYSGRLLAVLDGSSVKGWLKAYEDLKSFGNVTFVPGHGQPAKLKAFEFPTHSYLQLLFNHMSKAVDNGVSLQDAINSLDQSKYKKLANFNEISGRNASWAYLEREKAFFE